MKFPCLLYKTPGPHRKPGFGTYRYVGCKDAEQFKELAAQGWFQSLADALKPAPKPKKVATDE